MTGLIAAAAFLIGCSTTAPVGVNRLEFGNAVRQNIVAQQVNPNAPENHGPIEANGERAARAQARYEADQVETPADFSTQSSQAGGAGGGAATAGAN